MAADAEDLHGEGRGAGRRRRLGAGVRHRPPASAVERALTPGAAGRGARRCERGHRSPGFWAIYRPRELKIAASGLDIIMRAPPLAILERPVCAVLARPLPLLGALCALLAAVGASAADP